MNVFVTGGTGFIGSHTVVALLEAGHKVVIADDLRNSSIDVLARIEKITGKKPLFYKTDLCDKDALRRIFEENTIDAVIHFAGLKSVPESIEKPLEYYRNNLDSTLNLLEVMGEFGCRKIVFSSSATVYDSTRDEVPFAENMALAATNPYGWTKYMIERIITDYCAADSSWSAVLLRYFNPIGAHPSGLLGEDPTGIPQNLFPYLLRVYNGKLPFIRITGTDYPTPDGTGQRDYIHVCDLADGHLKALDYAFRSKGAEAVNLGTGRPTSVRELIAAFNKAAGVTLEQRECERRPGDIAVSYADPAKARRLFGWSARRGVDQMCADGINFAKLNPDGIK